MIMKEFEHKLVIIELRDPSSPFPPTSMLTSDRCLANPPEIEQSQQLKSLGKQGWRIVSVDWSRPFPAMSFLVLLERELDHKSS
jgi:hypothetical protein